MRKKCTAWLLLAAILLQTVSLTSLAPCLKANAASKSLSLAMAQKLAIANSETYRKIQNKIELQEIKYATAVKSIQMKKKNMSTFRWTPLLSFKFPEKPTLADEYEWQYKPLQITYVIKELKHQLSDDKIASREKVTQVFVETYMTQEKISSAQQRLDAAKETLQKNRMKLAAGEASKSDIDKMQEKVSKLTTELALQMRSFENSKSSLSKIINMDVTSGYTFLEPLVTADIPRSALDKLVEYTLANDQEYYNVKLEAQLSLKSLNMMQSMMRSKYGWKMNPIQPYIKQALNGERIDSSSFKKVYNEMLANVDRPWWGSRRILFIKIPRVWFKGAVDGERYVEDDPYALYAAALEHADAVREQASAKDELTKRVRSDFEAIKTAQIAYTDAVRALDSLKSDLDKGVKLNRLGSMTYEELAGIQDEYEAQELAVLDLLGTYSKLLYAYDRLTCGGITRFLEGTDVDMAAAQGGNSFLANEVKGTAYYYIEHAVEDNIFRLGVSIPEDYSIEITHFSLYVNGEQIGEKTEVEKYLEHLALDLDNTESVKIYVYNDDELVGACEIDPSVYQDKLEISGGYTLASKPGPKTVAVYSCSIDGGTNMAVLKITPEKTEPIAYYRLEDKNGASIFGEELVSVESEFKYLALLAGDFSGIKAVFYDKSKNLLYKGDFETGSSRIVAEK